MTKKKDCPYSDTDIARFYAKEIAHVFLSLRKISPTITNRLDADNPTWVAIETGGEETIRDYVLNLNDGAIANCPLSHSLTSDKKTLHIDHFYPASKLMKTLTELGHNQQLLRLIKDALQSLFKRENIHDTLIPTNNRGKLMINRVKVLYYNYIGNLWAISGRANSSKNKKNSFLFASTKILVSLNNIKAKKETINKIKQAIFNDVDLPWDDYKERNAYQQGLIIGSILNQKFNEKCPHQYYILPHYIEDNRFIFMFDFFKQFKISETTLRLSKKIEKYSYPSIEISQLTATSTILPRNDSEYKKGKVFNMALNFLYNSARKSLGDSESGTPSRLNSDQASLGDSEIDTPPRPTGSLPFTPDSETVKIAKTWVSNLSVFSNILDTEYKNKKRKREAEQENTDPRARNHTSNNPSSFFQEMVRNNLPSNFDQDCLIYCDANKENAHYN